jgi:hypothetical protein
MRGQEFHQSGSKEHSILEYLWPGAENRRGYYCPILKSEKLSKNKPKSLQAENKYSNQRKNNVFLEEKIAGSGQVTSKIAIKKSQASLNQSFTLLEQTRTVNSKKQRTTKQKYSPYMDSSQ